MPRGRPASQDQTTLQMALVGYEVERQRLTEKIREIEAQLGERAAPATTGPAAKKRGRRRRRTLSTEARARIAAAQRKKAGS